MWIFKNSPWDTFKNHKEDNIFTKQKDLFPFHYLNFDFNKKIMFFILSILFLFWMSLGIYQISDQDGEQAVIMRFGKFQRQAFPGLNYHLPWPIEQKIIQKVGKSRRIEIGYRSTNIKKINDTHLIRDINNESSMLTGDENIIKLNVDTMWHIKDLPKYTFNIDNPEETVQACAKSAIREVVGNIPISSILSNKKQIITVQIKELIQKILDQYNSGIYIEQVKLLKAEPPQEVIASYRDVQTAKADKERAINESESYMNNILPKARGESAKIIEEAKGYKAETISQAEGNTARFNSIYKEYIVNKDITKNRLYFENIESILADAHKIIVISKNVFPHLHIKNKNLLK